MRLRLLTACLLSLACALPAAARERRTAKPTPAAIRQPPAPLDPGAQCRAAIQAVERDQRVAPGLLLAIGRVESGRADPRAGLTPWPWTINAEGQGRHFESKEEAIAAVQELQGRGVRIIDVGCMQVNLFHHPQAFATLEEAFDPAVNTRYAAQFLKRLYATRGNDWEIAAANYHSATPERGEAYRLKVLAQWPAMAARLAELSQRDVLAAAWGAGTVPGSSGAQTVRINGFQAMALTQRPRLGWQDRGVMDPVPPIRIVGRQPNGRPVFVAELAEAPARR